MTVTRADRLPQITPHLDAELRSNSPELHRHMQSLQVALREWRREYERELGIVASSSFPWLTQAQQPFYGPTAPAITNADYDYRTIAPTGLLDGNDIYDPIYPGVDHFDVAAAVLEIPTGSTTEHMAALSAYVKNDVATSGGGRNGVGFFMAGMATVNDAATWGINTLLQDAATRATHSGTGRYIIGAELDFNVMGTNTNVIGVSVGGNSLAQPTNANAFLINALGTGYKWTGGLISFAGTCDYFTVCDLAATAAANVNSQRSIWKSRNASNTEVVTELKTVAGLIQVSSNGGTGETGFDFPTAGTRFRIDGANATHTNRFAFQERSSNQGTVPLAIPSGTGAFAGWRAYSNSDPSAALSFCDIAVIGSDRVRILSNQLNTGTVLPIKIELNTLVPATFDASGNATIGLPSLATNATDGFVYIPACAGAPSGTPTAKTGMIPLVYDSTNNVLYAYSGGAWRAH